jgi:hypothetical protein
MLDLRIFHLKEAPPTPETEAIPLRDGVVNETKHEKDCRVTANLIPISVPPLTGSRI